MCRIFKTHFDVLNVLKTSELTASGFYSHKTLLGVRALYSFGRHILGFILAQPGSNFGQNISR